MMILIALIASFCFAGAPKGPQADWTYAHKKLTQAGFQKSFIQSLKETYQKKDFEQTVELNLLLFLKKSDYHGPQVSAAAIHDVKKFLSAHQDVFKKAEKDHGVSSSVIASLLWIESRHGGVLGDFHVPSVYLHLLQSDRQDVIKHLHKNARFFTDKKITETIKKEITSRTQRKSQWALEELKALQKMHARDKQLVRTLKGSFAGAFGMPQFIPSSYNHWARPYKSKAVPNLLKAQDAIFSVAFYLRDNGWKRQQSKTYVKALMKYNNSEDYANAILKLARQVDGVSTPLRRVSTTGGE